MTKLIMLKPKLATLQQRIKPMTQTRNPEAEQRIRGRRWMTIRARYLREHPLCVECQRRGYAIPATELDHIIPLIDGGKDDPSNYQGLCETHHKEKTAEEARARQ